MTVLVQYLMLLILSILFTILVMLAIKTLADTLYCQDARRCQALRNKALVLIKAAWVLNAIVLIWWPGWAFCISFFILFGSILSYRLTEQTNG